MTSLFNTTLLKEQLKRYWTISALTFLGYFLSCLLPLWSAGDPGSAVDVILTILEMKHPFVILTNIVTPLAVVVALFSYMYRSNSTGVVHSLPFTKKQLFATNFLAGYLLVIVPLVVLSLLLLVIRVGFAPYSYTYADGSEYTRWIAANVFPYGLSTGQIINTLPVVLGFFARTLLSFTFYYILFITAAMIVGNQIIYLLVSGVLPFLPVGLYMLGELIAYYYIYGYSADMELAGEIMFFTSPVAMPAMFTSVLSNAAGATVIKSLVPYYAAYIVIAAALFAVSVWLYHTRKLERAGDTVVFTPLKNFFVFLLSVTGMVSLGLLLLAFLRNVAAMYVGFVIGFVIAFFVAQMIAEKSFNVFYKSKALLKHGAVALGIFAVVLIVTGLDLTGYERYVPEPAEIDGVYFGWISEVHGYEPNSPALDMMFISDPQVIDETVRLHQQIIDARSEQRKVFLDSMTNHRMSNTTRNIVYRLTNGKIVTREYTLSDTFHDEIGLSRLMKSEPVILSKAFWLNMPDALDNIALNPFRNETSAYDEVTYVGFGEIKIYDRAELRSLTEAVKKDYVYSQANEIWLNARNEGIQFNVHAQTVGNQLTNGGRVSNGSGLQEWYYVGIESAENTLAWLEDHGYELDEMNR